MSAGRTSTQGQALVQAIEALARTHNHSVSDPYKYRQEAQMQHFCDLENREAKEIVPGVLIRTFWGDEMLLSIADFIANAVVPTHSHPHEQAGTIISGKFELTISGETRWLKPGDTYIVPGGVEHGGRTGDIPARVLDIFSPVREEYQY
jgi:quercetin dioxygenase-like cupin family protein